MYKNLNIIFAVLLLLFISISSESIPEFLDQLNSSELEIQKLLNKKNMKNCSNNYTECRKTLLLKEFLLKKRIKFYEICLHTMLQVKQLLL